MSYLPPPAPAGQNKSLAVALSAGAGVAVVGAVVWGLITYLSKHQFSVIAVLLGLAVGTVVARIRPGDMAAAVGSAVISLLGAVLGTVLAGVFILINAGIGLSDLLAHIGTVLSITLKSQDFLGYLFWALAALFGFRIPMQVARGRKVVAAQPTVGPDGQMPQPFMPAAPGQAQPDGFGQPAYGQPPAAQPPYGQPPYGQPTGDVPRYEPPAP
jgi:small basic protein